MMTNTRKSDIRHPWNSIWIDTAYLAHFRRGKKLNTKRLVLIAAIVLTLFTTGCGSGGGGETGGNNPVGSSVSLTSTQTNTTGTSTATSTSTATTAGTTYGTNVAQALSGKFPNHGVSTDYVVVDSGRIPIRLNGSSVSVNSPQVSASGTRVTINSPGTYVVTGSLADGQLIVDSSAAGIVKVIFSGVSITCSDSSPFFVRNCEKAVLVLAGGTTNSLNDGSSYVFEDVAAGEPNGAIFSKDNLSICGSGTLKVTANFADGIVSKDGLVINGGDISVIAVDDGIRGKDYLVVDGGNLDIHAGGDGLKSTEDADASRGYVLVRGGAMKIVSAGDGISGQTDVLVSAGNISITAGGGSGRTVAADSSAKGIKGAASVIIDSGAISISSADDCLHTNGSLTLGNPTLSLSSGDDGVHADTSIVINDSAIDIGKSYEGIEAVSVILNGGKLRIIASDDGINGAGGADGSAAGSFPSPGNASLFINGGYFFITAAGDGIDINGAITMTAGTVIVNGPTENNNAAIDYDTSFKLSGGFLVAAGSSGMAMTAGPSSTQCALLVNLTSTMSAGTLFNIRTSGGENILTFAPSKNFQSVAFSSPKLLQGTSYTVSFGGSMSGTLSDGLYESGTYSNGTEFADFTISDIVTTIGTSGMGPGGIGDPGNPGNPGNPGGNGIPPGGFGPGSGTFPIGPGSGTFPIGPGSGTMPF